MDIGDIKGGEYCHGAYLHLQITEIISLKASAQLAIGLLNCRGGEVQLLNHFVR